MKKLFLILAAFPLFFSCGCAYLLFPSTGKALSGNDNKPFYGLIDKKVKLQRPLKVYKDILTDMDEEPSDSVILYKSPYNVARSENGKLSVRKLHKEPNELPEGSVLKFDYTSFYVYKDYTLFIPYKIRYAATFSVVNNPDISEKLKFSYIWGRGLYLHRAPWENDTVPESRYVGFNGKSYDPE